VPMLKHEPNAHFRGKALADHLLSLLLWRTSCTILPIIQPIMKFLLISFLLGTSLLSSTSVKAQTCPVLVWSDEFDGTALDPTKWEPQIGDGCSQGPDLCGCKL